MASGSPQVRRPLLAASDTETGEASSKLVPSSEINGLRNSTTAGGSATVTQWKIRYRDFVPSKKAPANTTCDFSDLIVKANEWLLKNTDVRALTCETFTWMDKEEKRLGDTEIMIHSRPIISGLKTHFLRGFRLWLVPSNGSEPVKKVCYFDVIPQRADTIQKLTETLNRRIEDNPLKGRLVNIQTVSVPHTDYVPDPNVVKWTEDSENDSQQAFLLRVYSLEEENCKVPLLSLQFIIQIRDFVPRQTDDGYEGFEQLVDNANLWLKDQTDCRIINVQSIFAPKLGTLSDTGNRCFYTLPGCSCELPTDFFRVLRAVYTKLHVRPADGPAYYPFYFETFMPQMTSNNQGRTGSKRETIEKMRDTCQRADEFLLSTGTEVLCCETVMNPMSSYDEEGQGPTDDMKWLVSLRLYTTQKELVPPPLYTTLQLCSSLVNSDSLKKAQEDEEAVEHPGPIFLGNVVNRQFKYRWIVVGISAVVVMTSIVVLSVVYSNLT